MPEFLKKFKISNNYSVYLYSIVVGLAAGLVSLIFVKALGYADWAVSRLHYYNVGSPDNLKSALELSDYLTIIMILFLPALGGFIAGWITNIFSKDAAGTGADEMIDAFHNKGGQMDSRLPIYKSLATIFTLASGGSGGKEGPIAQIGGSIGVWISNKLNKGERARRTLLLAGTAAGLGSVFRAPLGGALTAVEMVYREDIESDALIPCFIASVTSYLVFTGLLGDSDKLHVGYISEFHFNELIFYTILGILCFVFGFLFLKGFKDSKKFIGNLKINSLLKPAIGGFLVGCVCLFFYEASGTGSGFLQLVFDGLQPQYLGKSAFAVAIAFLLIAFLKVVATTLTIGSGGSAGIFGPSLFVGGMLGASVGIIAQHLLPGNDISVASYMVVGMGAFYAGVASAPIAGIIMVCEMTGSYLLLPPLILVSIFTFILSRKINFYKSQVHNRFKSPAHHWDMKMDVIKTITIGDYFGTFRRFAVITDDISFEKLQKLSVAIYASDYVVVDSENHYKGMISLRKYKLEEVKQDAANHYKQLIDKSIPAVNVTSNLTDALNVIMVYDVDKVAIVNEKNFVLGYIRARDIFNAYQKSVAK